jgi:hypothetical protein
MRNLNSPQSQKKFRLHPLIHTSLKFIEAQDVEKKKAEPKTPHFLSLKQDIVGWLQVEKWGLKYVISSLKQKGRTFLTLPLYNQ